MPASTSESPRSVSTVGARGRSKSFPVKLTAGGARLHSRIAAFCLVRWRTRPGQIISRKADSGRRPPPLPNRRFLPRSLAHAAGANHLPQSCQRAMPATTSESPLSASSVGARGRGKSSPAKLPAGGARLHIRIAAFCLDRWRTRPEQIISRKATSGRCPPPLPNCRCSGSTVGVRGRSKSSPVKLPAGGAHLRLQAILSLCMTAKSGRRPPWQLPLFGFFYPPPTLPSRPAALPPECAAGCAPPAAIPAPASCPAPARSASASCRGSSAAR